jgi:hypothetical protein
MNGIMIPAKKKGWETSCVSIIFFTSHVFAATVLVLLPTTLPPWERLCQYYFFYLMLSLPKLKMMWMLLELPCVWCNRARRTVLIITIITTVIILKKSLHLSI